MTMKLSESPRDDRYLHFAMIGVLLFRKSFSLTPPVGFHNVSNSSQSLRHALAFKGRVP